MLFGKIIGDLLKEIDWLVLAQTNGMDLPCFKICTGVQIFYRHPGAIII